MNPRLSQARASVKARESDRQVFLVGVARTRARPHTPTLANTVHHFPPTTVSITDSLTGLQLPHSFAGLDYNLRRPGLTVT